MSEAPEDENVTDDLVEQLLKDFAGDARPATLEDVAKLLAALAFQQEGLIAVFLTATTGRDAPEYMSYARRSVAALEASNNLITQGLRDIYARREVQDE